MTTPKQPPQHSRVLWFTGLSGAGKSTLAGLVANHLREQGYTCDLLDGDQVRRTVSKDLGFSEADRRENIRRLGELALKAVNANRIAVVAAISPLRTARDSVRDLFPSGQFIEVFVDAPLGVCESRDPKGLYRKARQGVIRQFTGIDSIYEVPDQPEIHLRTNELRPDQCVEIIQDFLDNARSK